MKAIVDATSGQILGAAVLGLEGGEIMSMLEIAMMGKLSYERLRDAIFAHPTLPNPSTTCLCISIRKASPSHCLRCRM